MHWFNYIARKNCSAIFRKRRNQFSCDWTVFKAPVWIHRAKNMFKNIGKSILHWSWINARTTSTIERSNDSKKWEDSYSKKKRLTRIDMPKICRLLSLLCVYGYGSILCVCACGAFIFTIHILFVQCARTLLVVCLNIKSCFTGAFGVEVKSEKNMEWWRHTEWTSPRATEPAAAWTNRRVNGWMVGLSS